MNPPQEPFNRQINSEAAEWFVEFNTAEPDEEARRRFDAWLRASPQHTRAYLEMFPIWQDAGSLGIAEDRPADELIALARSATNIVPLDVPHTQDHARAEPAPGVKPRAAGAFVTRLANARFYALAASVLFCVAAAALYGYAQRGVYETGIGEQRVVALGDGTTIELNARSRLKVRYSERLRSIELRQGQALFSVARDPARPFIVDANGTQVRAIGTQFDVYRKRSGTVVTVLEGRVAILPAGAPAHVGIQSPRPGSASSSEPSTQPLQQGVETNGRTLAATSGETLLSAGEQLAVTGVAATRASRADVAAATAWRERRVIFSSTALSDVVEEFNRYNERQLVVRDETLGTLNISGVFSTTDLPSLVRFLRAQPGIAVDEDESEIRIGLR
jgi:transmembrane sensor